MRAAWIATVAVLGVLTACSDSVGGSGQPVGAVGPSRTAAGDSGGGAERGVVHKVFEVRDHVDGHVDYPDSPPFGGQHSPEWADCTGTVYTRPVPNENAVHALEHGAVWVTYRPDLGPAEVRALGALAGEDYTFMSPYPGLDHAVSIQSWGYQLRTDDVHDPRLRAFITEHRQNPKETPEYGATCSNPGFPVG